MKSLRAYVVLVVVAVAFAYSIVLFRRAVGLTSPWFGLVVMLDFLGLVAFSRSLFLLRLPSFLRKEREWEMAGGLYKALRVPTFGAVLRRTPLRYLNPLVYLKKHPNPLVMKSQIESAEAAHLVAAALLTPFIAYACVDGRWETAAWLMVVQIGFNLYPILHLRWVRARICRLQRRG